MMDKIINKMIKKRKDSSAITNIDKNLHMASLITKKNHILSMGENKYNTTKKNGYSIHAEINTMQKSARNVLMKKKRSIYKKSIKVDLIVIRTSLNNSMPCYHCISSMVKNNIFNIRRVYYSINGTLKYKSLNSLLLLDDHHISKGNKEEEEDSDDDKPNLRG